MQQIINHKGIPLPEELNQIAHKEEQRYNPGWGGTNDSDRDWLNSNLDWSTTDQGHNFWNEIFRAPDLETIFKVFVDHYGRPPDPNWTPPPPPTIEEVFKF